MIVNFSFGYGFKPTAEIAEKLNKVLLDQKIEIGENGEIKNGWRNYTADIADIIDIVDVGEIKIVPKAGVPSTQGRGQTLRITIANSGRRLRRYLVQITLPLDLNDFGRTTVGLWH